MSEPILFYDIPSHAKGIAWSPNTWKTRFCLNIKGIPYRTVWVEYPDIKSLCLKIGASHTNVRADGSLYYSLPVIQDPNTEKIIADSAAIVRYLDKALPDSRRLIPDGADDVFAAFQRDFYKVYGPGFLYISVLVPAIYERLREGSKPYFLTTREKMFGKFEELAPEGSEKRASLFEQLRGSLHEVATQWYEENGKEKRFFMGDEIGITFADIIVASFLMWFKIILGEDSEEWKGMMCWDDGRWARFLTSFEAYEVVDDGEDVEL